MGNAIRQAVLDQIMAFPSEEARVLAYLELCEGERRTYNANPPVLMCTCSEWETCMHPWPQRMRLEPSRG